MIPRASLSLSPSLSQLPIPHLNYPSIHHPNSNKPPFKPFNLNLHPSYTFLPFISSKMHPFLTDITKSSISLASPPPTHLLLYPSRSHSCVFCARARATSATTTLRYSRRERRRRRRLSRSLLSPSIPRKQEQQ